VSDPTSKREQDLWRALGWLVVAAGALVRITQYLAAPSLWLDELATARNVLDRGVSELLFSPLDYFQVAPAGFLALEKLTASLLGDSELALRLVPVSAGIAALVAARSLAARVLSGSAAFAALTFLAFSPPVVWLSCVVKHISFDLLGSSAVAALALSYLERPSDRKRWVLLAVSGAAAAFVSTASVLVIGGVGLAVALALLRASARPSRRGVFALGVVWGVAASAALALALHNLSPETSRHQLASWQAGFPTIPPLAASDWLWPWERLRSCFEALAVAPGAATALAALALLGAGRLVLHQRAAASVLLGPIALALAAAAFHLYPIAERLSLYLTPSLLVLTAAGAEQLVDLATQPRAEIATALGRAALWLRSLPALLAVIPLAGFTHALPPYRVQDARGVYQQLASKREPGDAVYLYYGAWQSAAYYAPRAGIAFSELDLGTCTPDWHNVLHELDHYRGRSRVWVVVVHPTRIEKALIDKYLGSIGVERDRIAAASHTWRGSADDVTARLYDLSQPERLASLFAEQIRMPAHFAKLGRSNPCEGPVRPPSAAWLARRARADH
jgi:hypothetical protein